MYCKWNKPFDIWQINCTDDRNIMWKAVNEKLINSLFGILDIESKSLTCSPYWPLQLKTMTAILNTTNTMTAIWNTITQ